MEEGSRWPQRLHSMQIDSDQDIESEKENLKQLYDTTLS